MPVSPSPEITILNMVFTVDLGIEPSLPAVAAGLSLNQTESEPEQFSGLIYRPDEPAVVLLLFSTGTLIITGATEPATAETTLTLFANQLADLGLRERCQARNGE